MTNGRDEIKKKKIKREGKEVYITDSDRPQILSNTVLYWSN